ncbi:MAG: hypothetical protein ACXWBO_16160 [Ilumatobacteraceae bacterium]
MVDPLGLDAPMSSSEAPVEVQVGALLTGLDSANLDVWVAAHSAVIAAVEIQPSCVLLRGRVSFAGTATATRRPGLIVAALDEALYRLQIGRNGS